MDLKDQEIFDAIVAEFKLTHEEEFLEVFQYARLPGGGYGVLAPGPRPDYELQVAMDHGDTLNREVKKLLMPLVNSLKKSTEIIDSFEFSGKRPDREDLLTLLRVRTEDATGNSDGFSEFEELRNQIRLITQIVESAIARADLKVGRPADDFEFYIAWRLCRYWGEVLKRKVSINITPEGEPRKTGGFSQFLFRFFVLVVEGGNASKAKTQLRKVVPLFNKGEVPENIREWDSKWF